MMKFILYIAAIALLAVGCGRSNQSKKNEIVFAPKKSETKVEYHHTTQFTLEDAISSRIKLSVMVPAEFNTSNQQLMQNKLLQLISRAGKSGLGGAPPIVVAPLFALLSESVTATAPAKTMIKYNLTLYVANILSGDVYSTTSLDIVGVGDSAPLALQNAIESISVSDPTILKMISDAEERIINYYKQNGDKIIIQAKNAARNNNLDEAVALLSSIPMDCGDLYYKAQKALTPIYEANVTNQAERALASMRRCLVTSSPENFAEAMYYYEQIPHNSSTRKGADALYTSTKTALEKSAQEMLDREYALADEALKATNERELLAMQMTLNAKDVLMDKYRSDAAYERLPWIRKVIHLGDYDPFDGSGTFEVK